jgi:hypothetical protein
VATTASSCTRAATASGRRGTGCQAHQPDGQFCSNPSPDDASVCGGPGQPGPASFTHLFDRPGKYFYFTSTDSPIAQVIVSRPL